jgi:nitrogen regulatory protein PII
MKKIEAIVRHFKLEDVKNALIEIVSDLGETIRIRTGETGSDAL